MSELSKLEREALELIRTEGGVLQSELWKKLDCSAGKGSEIARKLEDLGLVEREKVTANQTSTFSLQPKRKKAEDLDFSLLLAGDLLPPFIGGENVEPTDDRFTQWILKLDEEYRDDP